MILQKMLLQYLMERIGIIGINITYKHHNYEKNYLYHFIIYWN
jgi:hypothetical protein